MPPRSKFDLRQTRSRRTYGNGARTSSGALSTIARSAGVTKLRTMPMPTMYVQPTAMPAGEKKFFDTTLSSTSLATAGVVLNDSLNLIPQNVTETGRIGRKVVIRKIHMRGFMILAANATASSEVYRVMLVLDRQANGAAATVLNVLDTADEKSYNNLANSGRFLVLKDWYGAMNKTADVGTNINSVIKTFTYNKSCEIPLEFDAAVGAITEIRSNNLFLIGISSSTTISVSHTTRVRYSDK